MSWNFNEFVDNCTSTVGAAVKFGASILGFNASFHDEVTNFSLYEGTTLGPIKFYISSVNGEKLLYAFNSDTKRTAYISIPNIINNEIISGVIIFIPPTQKVAIGDILSSLMYDIKITVGLIDEEETEEIEKTERLNELSKPKITFSFHNLSISNGVDIQGIKLSCTNNQLNVSTGTLSIGAISQFFISSIAGRTVQINKRLEPQQNSQNTNHSCVFDINFGELFDMDKDVLNGTITFEISDSYENILNLSARKSEPLHPLEMEYFKKIESN